jgi:hypothetical protein
MWCSVPVGCHKFAVQVGCGWSTCFFVSGQTGYVRISSTMFDQLLTRSVDFDIFLQVFRWISSRLISQCLWKPRWNHRSGRECCHLFWRYQVELLEPVNSLGNYWESCHFFRHSQHLQTSWMFGRSEHLRTLEHSSMKFDDLLGIFIVFEADESRCT